MELPKYPSTTPVPMPDESLARQSATALLVFEAVALGVSLPIQLLMLLSLGWEGGDEALKQRLLDTLPLLGGIALITAVVAGVAASSVWRDLGDASKLTAATAVLVTVLAIGWAASLRGALVDPMLGPVWCVLTLPGPLALILLTVARRRVRRENALPPR